MKVSDQCSRSERTSAERRGEYKKKKTKENGAAWRAYPPTTAVCRHINSGKKDSKHGTPSSDGRMFEQTRHIRAQYAERFTIIFFYWYNEK
jgi:hypothetical protein